MHYDHSLITLTAPVNGLKLERFHFCKSITFDAMHLNNIHSFPNPTVQCRKEQTEKFKTVIICNILDNNCNNCTRNFALQHRKTVYTRCKYFIGTEGLSHGVR